MKIVNYIWQFVRAQGNGQQTELEKTIDDKER